MTRAERVRVVVAVFSALMVAVAVWEPAVGALALTAVLGVLLTVALVRWVLA